VLDLAARSQVALMRLQSARWAARMEAEHDNVRAALTWAVERGEAQTALQLGADLWRFWHRRRYIWEGRRWLEAALALPGGAAATRAWALRAAGFLAYYGGDQAQAAAWLEACAVLSRSLEPASLGPLWSVLRLLGRLATERGEVDRATALLNEVLAVARGGDSRQAVAGFDSRRETAIALGDLADLAVVQGDVGRAAVLLDPDLLRAY
jgi:hypothetical protein